MTGYFLSIFPEGKYTPKELGRDAATNVNSVRAVMARDDVPDEAKDVIAAFVWNTEKHSRWADWMLEQLIAAEKGEQ
ncbi:MAG: hypothetical protein AAFX52_11010 [Pseudomonadota bacterium]